MSRNNNGTERFNESTPHVTGLAPAGVAYVPAACRAAAARCRVHFSLHGCSLEEYYDDAVHHLSFAGWAEANALVLVFPRLQPFGGTVATQAGCWDGYGQTGTDYALKSGAQMRAVHSMMAELLQPAPAP